MSARAWQARRTKSPRRAYWLTVTGKTDDARERRLNRDQARIDRRFDRRLSRHPEERAAMNGALAEFMGTIDWGGMLAGFRKLGAELVAWWDRATGADAAPGLRAPEDGAQPGVPPLGVPPLELPQLSQGPSVFTLAQRHGKLAMTEALRTELERRGVSVITPETGADQK